MKLTISYLNKKHEFEVDKDEKIKDAIKRFLESVGESELSGVRFVALGKFLDAEKSFSDEGVSEGTPVKAFKSLSNKKSSTTQSSAQPNQQPNNPNQSTNQFNPLNMPGMNMPGNNMMDMNISPSVINNQLDALMNDPSLLDMTIRTMLPNATDSERENFKSTFVENCKRMKENPGMMDMMSNHMKGMMQGQNQPMMNNPYGSPYQNNNQFMNQGNQFGSPSFYQAPTHYDFLTNQYYQASPSVPCSHGYYPLNMQNLMAEHMKKETVKKEMTLEEAEKKYQNQLNHLFSMGYSNKTKNLKALIKCGGDVNSAVNYILDNVGNDD